MNSTPPPPAPPATASALRRPVLFSILAAVLTLLLKAAAYVYTGSVGLLSDAAESSVNLVAAVTAWVSLWYAAKPVDVEHTYGHKKIEYFSSGLEGTLILAAAAGIAWYSVKRLVVPQPLHQPGVGAAVALLASAVNLVVALWLLRVGRRYGSIILEADGQHLLTDVWTSVGVVAGLGLVAVTHLEWLDPVIGLVVSVNILWTGWRLVVRSFDGLMDHALPAAEQALVRGAIEAQLGPGTAYHALRTRQAGTDRFVDFHLLVPGRTDVARAHRLAVRIETAIRSALPGTEVVVHIEPIEEPASWEDSELLAIEQDKNRK
ncbi:MAG TPA: cation diffusion facilitator family transporter [Gemmataceae bacterium]